MLALLVVVVNKHNFDVIAEKDEDLDDVDQDIVCVINYHHRAEHNHLADVIIVVVVSMSLTNNDQDVSTRLMITLLHRHVHVHVHLCLKTSSSPSAVSLIIHSSYHHHPSNKCYS